MAVHTSQKGSRLSISSARFDDAKSDETSGYDRAVQIDAIDEILMVLHKYGVCKKHETKEMTQTEIDSHNETYKKTWASGSHVVSDTIHSSTTDAIATIIRALGNPNALFKDAPNASDLYTSLPDA